MLIKVRLFISTIIYLRPKQVFYQIYYRFKKLVPRKRRTFQDKEIKFNELKWENKIFSPELFKKDYSFCFINKYKNFEGNVDWNYLDNGKLWLYNLNYFEYLNQKQIDASGGYSLIKDYINDYGNIIIGKESYPTSLRIINWIKFLSKHNIKEQVIFEVIREDAERLYNNIEYHILGNHLLENGFALFYISKLFGEKKFIKVARKILISQLDEQILEDGCHFELSPMYHQIMLLRVLDCINLEELNPSKENNDILKLFREKASKMCSWLYSVTYYNGSIPLVNDAANNIAPTTKQLLNYARELDVYHGYTNLSESGYRMITGPYYELFLDVGKIGPSYIPGHAHADTFSFETYFDGQPVIVDTGTSNYDLGDTRCHERSTSSHNTVTINDDNSSEVWKVFRVGKRASIKALSENPNSIKSVHNGFRKHGALHQREWSWDDSGFVINDKVISKNKTLKNVSFLHFHPFVQLYFDMGKYILNEKYAIKIVGAKCHHIEDYSYAPEFNKKITSKKLCINFDSDLKLIFFKI